jgi:DNA-binding transcriptional MocR family regulator
MRVTVASHRGEVLVQLWNSGLVLSPQWRELAPSASEALAMAVRDAVLDGKIRVADQLPAERRLASQLGVSRGTVVAAFARLRAEGWLSTRHGSGSTVQIPASLRLRFEPLPVHAEGLIDLRRATPAAPVDAYTAAAQRALGRSPRLLLSDGEPGAGLPRLRERIAARLTGQGLPTGPDQVLVTAGARAAMTLLTAHLRPSTAVVESPTFYGILAILRRPGRRLIPVAVSHDGWDPGQLAAAFGRARGGMAVLVPDFHNPTGALMDAPARAQVAALAARAGVTVIANEIMRDLDMREPPAPAPRIRGAIIVGSLSKTIWAGLRIGWIRAPARLIRQLLLHPLCQVCSPPPIEQLTACELLPDLDGLLRQRTRELRSQRDHLAAALRHDSAWTFTPPPGGLWLWLRLASTSGDALAAQAAAVGLAVLPGSRFSADGTLASYLRVPFTAPPATLDNAVALLRAAHGNAISRGKG